MKIVKLAHEKVDEKVRNCKTGFESLDSKIQLFEPGKITILAGRPAMGKTSVAFLVQNHILKNEEIRCIGFWGISSLDDLVLDDLKETVQKDNVRIFIVDYLQLIRSDMKTVMQRLQEIATTFNIAILACSQLNRTVEERPNHIPTLADLDPIIEQYAHHIVFITRKSYYESAIEEADKRWLLGNKVRNVRLSGQIEDLEFIIGR